MTTVSTEYYLFSSTRALAFYPNLHFTEQFATVDNNEL